MMDNNAMELVFDRPVLNLLVATLRNEKDRWVKYCLSGKASFEEKNNYESDMVYLDELIMGFKFYLEQGCEVNVSLNSRDAGYVIEALDNEIAIYKNPLAFFSKEEWQLLNEVREQIRKKALQIFGEEILHIAHYDRSRE